MRVTKWRVAAAVVALIALSTTTAYATHVFTDVEDGRFYADAAEWAKDNGITFGCGDGTTFCPDDPVTRGENVTFAKRYDDNVVQPALTALESRQPVAAFAGGNQSQPLTTADTVVRSVTLTAPTDGTVLVQSSGYIFLAAGTDGLARCSLTTGTELDGAAFQYVEINADAPAASDVISGVRGFDVSAGAFTVNLVCDIFTGSDAMTVADTHITALFVADAPAS